ncbi:hypothetical protein GH5_08541 [Leishmania sp. Ghana 2012 LV757]|uniref:hypothetical protein n=1 Tax=Leishmania sp. Ghana 2012 LV757 TaxID=2803181 RepID=UPI001B49A0D9|nr:hypothetical protein GH5_08541 [Leishmania sp. Ghana 2012 LV757]
MSAAVKTAAPAAVRGSRRWDPSCYYQSLSAVVDGDVQFGEGCVVLSHARIHVSPGYRLLVGPFCLFEDFSELICDSAAAVAGHRRVGEGQASSAALADADSASPSWKAAVTLRIGSHNHLHSYARVRCTVATPTQSPCSPSSPTWQLMGRGNVLHAFADVLMTLPQASLRLARPPAAQAQSFFGNYNVVTTHSRVSLPQAAAAAPSANAGEQGARRPRPDEHRGTQLLDAPQRSVISNELPPSAAALSVETLPKPVPVEERLFHDEDDVDVLGGAHAQTQAPTAYSAPHPRAGDCIHSEAASLSASAGPSIEASSGFQHLVFFSSETHTGVAEASAALAASAFSVPRFGARSVAELPVVINRIADEAKAGPETAAETVGTASVVAAPPPFASASPPSGSSAAASPTAAMLERCVSDVHPHLRLHEEKRIIREVERVCRYYIAHFLDDRGLKLAEAP